MYDGVKTMKICDFNLSKLLDPADIKVKKIKVNGVMRPATSSCTGTPLYMAPEMFSYKYYSFEVDWWAFGVLMFIMRSGSYFFKIRDEKNFISELKKSTPDFSKGKFCSQMTDLISRCLEKDPQKRLGCNEDLKEIKNHSLFKRFSLLKLSISRSGKDLGTKIDKSETKTPIFKKYEHVCDYFKKANLYLNTHSSEKEKSKSKSINFNVRNFYYVKPGYFKEF
ncbi:MAG: hypothetical protein MHPSP_000074 [Paramarteilia canceri]